MKLLKYILLLFLTVSLQVTTSAQDWTSYQSQTKINDLVDTGSELLMATDIGLVVLNKVTFEKTIFTTSNSNLSFNHIESITQNASGDTWIGTYDMRLAQFDGTDFQDEVIPTGITNPITVELYDIEFAPNGDFWVGTSEGIFHQQGQNWTKYDEAELGDDFFAVWDIEINNAGEVFAGALDILKFSNGTWSNISESTNLLSYLHAELFLTSTGDLFFLGDLDNIGRFDGTTWQEIDNGNLNGSEAINFTEDTNGDIYYSTQRDGIFKLENNTWVLQADMETEAPYDDKVSYFYIDDQNIQWFNNQIYLSANDNGTVQHTLITDHTIDGNNVQNVHKGVNGHMYFMTSKYSNISVVDTEGNWSILVPPSDLSEILFVFDILVLADNDIWLATDSRLYHYDGNEWTYDEFGCNDLLADSQGKIYASSSDKIYMIDNGTITEYNTDNSAISTFIISGIGLDINDDLWIASFTWEGDKLIQKVSTDGTWTSYDDIVYPPFNASYPIGDFHFDVNGNVWVSLNIIGALKFDGTNWSNPFVDDADIVENNEVQSIQSDANGKMYFSNYLGVTTLLDGEWDYLNIEEIPDANSSATTNIEFDDNGVLWWGSSREGIFSYTPEIVSTIGSNNVLVNDFSVYPNPAINYTILDFTLEESANVNILIHNYVGQLQTSLDLGQLSVGAFQQRIDMTRFAKGFYTIQIKINNQSSTKTMIVR